MQIGLTVVWFVLWIAAIGLGLGALVAIASAVMQDVWFPDGLDLGRSVRINAGGVQVVGAQALGWPIVTASFLAGGVAVAASLVIVDRLRKLFDKFSSDAPFDRENAQHLRVIWITMLFAELARYVIAAIVFGLAVGPGRPDGVSISIDPGINLSTWGAILILVVLAEVFREGAKLRDEQDLTI